MAKAKKVSSIPPQSGSTGALPVSTPALPEAPINGTSVAGTGVQGLSNTGNGVVGECVGAAGSPITHPAPPVSDGVLGIGKNGVHGQTNVQTGYGVFGENLSNVTADNGGAGVCGTSKTGFGVHGSSSGDGAADSRTLSLYSGVYGQHTGNNGPGVFGSGNGGFGVLAVSIKNYGLYASGTKGAAKFQGDVNVVGAVITTASVSAATLAVSGNSTMSGNLTVSGDIFLPGADCAERFDVADAHEIQPGAVVAIDADGRLRECAREYDQKVAGVVSGAGAFRPGIVLDQGPSRPAGVAVALIGKAYCKVDADIAPIAVGDLLTTSATAGHAMKASDPSRAFGAVIGKALCALSAGKALIPVLIALQ